MGDGVQCHVMLDDDDDADDASVHSAISNASDFEDDEEVEYLALELVHHLPQGQAERLLRNMRAKEKAVQDLLHRNRMLLDSCRTLDDENQVLTEQVREAECKQAEIESKPAAPASVAAPGVDSSVFLQIEQGKEQKILKLTKENEHMAVQLRRLDENNQRMEEAMVQMKKELKKAQQQTRSRGEQPPVRSASSTDDLLDRRVLEEEERIFRELQGNSAQELVLQKIQQQQADSRGRIESALRALLNEDMQRIERWRSDTVAVFLALDGLEESKHLKKGKSAPAGNSAPGGPTISSEHLSEVSSSLLGEFDAMMRHVEDVEKVPLSLEQPSHGAETTVSEMGLGASIAAAEGSNASWVDRMQALNLEPMADQLRRTEAAVNVLLESAPPGLLPPTAEDCLRETRSQVAELCSQLGMQADSLRALQEESSSFGRRIRNLQAAQKAQIQRCMTEARSRVSDALEELLATAARRPPGPSVSEAHQNDAILGEVRNVRSMVKALTSSLETAGRTAQTRMEQVSAVLVGDPVPGASGASSTGQKPGRQENKADTKAPAVEPAAQGTDAKKKKKKNKGRNDPGSPERETKAEPRTNPAATAAGGAVDTPSGGGEGGGKTSRSLTGQELLHELEALRADSAALEARMAARREGRTPRGSADAIATPRAAAPSVPKVDEDVEVVDAAAVKAAAARRRKNRFA